MCNLYSMARSRDEVRRLFQVTQDRTANLPPLPAIFPDQLAPVVKKSPPHATHLSETPAPCPLFVNPWRTNPVVRRGCELARLQQEGVTP